MEAIDPRDFRADDSAMCASPVKKPSGEEPSRHPAVQSWSFKEIFGGNAHLTSTFKQRGVLNVKPPLELMSRGKPVESQNILNDAVFKQLCREAQQPRQLWHFGFPCGSFSIMQNMNKGTRTKNNPLGREHSNVR